MVMFSLKMLLQTMHKQQTVKDVSAVLPYRGITMHSVPVPCSINSITACKLPITAVVLHLCPYYRTKYYGYSIYHVALF